MRRLISVALVALLVFQGSPAAIAAPESSFSAPSLLAEVHLAFSQALESFTMTQIGALLTGQTLYSAMHAPAPDFRNVRAAAAQTPIRPNLHPTLVPPVLHAGVLLHPQVTDPRTFNLKSPPRDPLAMSPSTASTHRSLVRSAVPLQRWTPAPIRFNLATPKPVHRLTAGPIAGNGVTGVNPWWSYEEGALPGVGKWMVNVGTGNVLIQEDDVDVKERGIDLAFRMTYNSMSQHDAAGTDGSTPSNYGNGWTNTFDAHMSQDPSKQNVLTVWDIDGARYDYTSDGKGGWIPPPGVHAQLAWDGGCGYFWIKKSGTRYHFWSPYAACNTPQAYWGRAVMIQARNYNNWIRFDYSWDNGDASTSAHLSQINAVHADGQSLTLIFADFNGYRELHTITRPGGAQVTYTYDSSGDPTSITLPTNNSNYGTHQYGWYAGHQVNWVASPRWNQASNDGGYGYFWFDSSARVSAIQLSGIANFTPSDGTNSLLQPNAATSTVAITYTAFAYPSATETDLKDADGHAAKWFYDTSGRVTESDEWNGSTTDPLWLSSQATWDAQNNLTRTVDPRQQATDYAYDTNGNTIAVAQPAVATNAGTFRPTSLYSYDGYSNLLAYCDPAKVGAAGYDWTNRPQSDTLCAVATGATGATQYVWNTSDTANEPYGYLTDTYTPLGNHITISYNTANEGGDNGLPTDVLGQSFTQDDGKLVQPQQHFTYDPNGNIATYSKGYGNWSLSYDTVNRLTTATDPDGVTSRTCYYADGEVSAKQSAYEYALDGNVVCGSHSEQFTYDANGDEISETHHYGQTATNGVSAGVTQKWYDGADRLIEVQLPSDAYTDNSAAWRTRYIYDLAQGKNVSIAASNQTPSFPAYGNLYKTQNFFNGGWNDVNGNAFDALNRSINRYQYSPGQGLQTWTSAYDAGTNSSGISNSGLLISKTDPLSVVTSYSYDALGRQTDISFNGDGGVTPPRTYTFDPDGRVATVQSSLTGTESFTYDADGRETQYQEGSGGGATSPATLNYTYYPDGSRWTLSISSSALSQQNEFTYDYRNDGLRTKLTVANQSQPFFWTYTNAGRELTQSDPVTGTYMPAMGNLAAHTVVARTQSYDSYGQLSSIEIPDHGTYANIGHDSEGNTTSFQVTGDDITGTNTITAAQYGYDVRGEQTTTQTTSGQGVYEPFSSSSYLYGHNCAVAPVHSPTSTDCGMYTETTGTHTYGVPAQTVDPYTGAGQTGGSMYVGYNDPDCSNSRVYSGALAFDKDGRQTSESLQAYNCSSVTTNTEDTRTYDAENHVISDASQYDSSSSPAGVQPGYSTPGATYTWNALGKARVINDQGYGAQGTSSGGPAAACSAGPYTLHWDGDDLLFITNSSGALVQVDAEKLGGQGFGCAAGNSLGAFRVLDRDVSGTQVAFHSSMGESPWIILPAHSFSLGKLSGYTCGSTCVGLTTSASAVDFTRTLLFNAPREDGYMIGNVNIQGVRAYDPTTAQWSSPDAYKGDVHDPMSQRSYMWNNNNPIAYSDPSGYAPWTFQFGYGGLTIKVSGMHVSVSTDKSKFVRGAVVDAGKLAGGLVGKFVGAKVGAGVGSGVGGRIGASAGAELGPPGIVAGVIAGSAAGAAIGKKAGSWAGAGVGQQVGGIIAGALYDHAVDSSKAASHSPVNHGRKVADKRH